MPVPDERGLECRHRLREVIVSSPPQVDHLGAADMKPFSDFVCTHDVLWLDAVGHGPTVTLEATRPVDVRIRR